MPNNRIYAWLQHRKAATGKTAKIQNVKHRESEKQNHRKHAEEADRKQDLEQTEGSKAARQAD